MDAEQCSLDLEVRVMKSNTKQDSKDTWKHQLKGRETNEGLGECWLRALKSLSAGGGSSVAAPR